MRNEIYKSTRTRDPHVSANWTFSFWLVPLIKSLNWPWSTKILGQFVTRLCKNRLWYWKYRSLWHQTHFDVTDKNNNFSFEDLDIHYHSSSCRTHYKTSDNVCLKLQNCCYSILIIFQNIYLWKWQISVISKFSLWSHQVRLSASMNWLWY
jgi:hypothetical protein